MYHVSIFLNLKCALTLFWYTLGFQGYLIEPSQAYQVLKRGGLDDDHIVVMHTNDLAGNFMNPHPGQIFNSPGGQDVYDGVPLV